MHKSTDSATLVGMIGDLGYRAQIGKGGVIRTAMSGYQTLIFSFDDSIQFYFGIELDEREVTLDQINSFNRKYRFTKCYLENASINLEMDAFFDETSPSSKVYLEYLFEAFESGISSIDKVLLKTTDDEDD